MALLMISPDQLKTLLHSEAKPLLLDVRELDELTGPLGSIDNIIHIPLGRLAGRVRELKRAQNPDIVIICRSGARAMSAARIVFDAGFKKVSVLEGGMVAWNAA